MPMSSATPQRWQFLPAIILAAASFLLLDTLVLALNYRITWEVEKDALSINLAGRQRMLSQRLTKVLLETDYVNAAGNSTSAHREELALTFGLFDSTLNAFLSGGVVTTGSGGRARIDPLDDDEARLIATRAATIWSPFSDHIARIIQNAAHTPQREFDDTLNYALVHNLELLNLMNLLTSRVELLSNEQASRLRLLLTAAFILALLNFALILRLLYRQLCSLSEARQRIGTVLNNIAASVLEIDHEGRVRRGNSTAERLFGYGVGMLEGLRETDLLSNTKEGATGHRKDGSQFLASCVRAEIATGDECTNLISVFDITKEKEAERALVQIAHHDTLTGLCNRLLLEDRIGQAVAKARRDDELFAIIYLDLDKFKAVNDTHGHRAGDAVLCEAAARLRGCVREVDTVARLGGDEFVVLVTNLSDATGCSRVSEKILDIVPAPFLVEGQTIDIGTSLGISLYPVDAEDPHVLLRMADKAMYRAKARGGNCAEFFSFTEIRCMPALRSS